MKLLSIQVGLPQTFGRADAPDPLDQAWTSGIFKEPVAGPVWLGITGLAGDGQANRDAHGGPDKAVNVYPQVHYAHWAAALDLTDLSGGSFGENFTTAGPLEAQVCIGDIFDVGAARVQITQPRQPCWKLARRWRLRDLAATVQRSGRTGWYLRVLQEGWVAAGDALVLLDRPHPEWPVTTANAVMFERTADHAAAQALAACPALSTSWRDTLMQRIARPQKSP